MRTFQIKQTFGETGFGYSYFEVPFPLSEKGIKETARSVQIKEYNQRPTSLMGFKSLERPTIHVREYNTDKNRIEKNGFSFSVKWR